MNDSIVRYQLNPALTDTVGFFDYCVPLTNESQPPRADSLKKFYDYSVYDFVTPLPPGKELRAVKSIFKPHDLQPRHHGALAIERQSTDWIIITFLACLVIIAWIQASYAKRLSQIFKAVAQPHYINQLERDGNLFKERIALGLSFIYYATTSVFVFIFMRDYIGVPAGFSNLVFTLLVFAGIFTYQMLKSFIIFISGIIFNTRESSRQYQLNIMIFNHVIGLVLFPITLIAFYGDASVLLTAGIVIIVLLVAYRLIRSILLGLTNKSYNLFYLFLYLCTLEILPLLLLFKVMSKM